MRQQDALTQANWERQFQYSQQAAAAKSSTKSSGSTGSASSGKPKLTYAQALAAIENGQVTSAVKEAYDYYMGSGAYDGFYGTKSNANAPAGGVSYDLAAVQRSLGEQLSNGREDRALSYLGSIWNGLTSAQQQEVQALLAQYKLQYNP